MFCYNNAGKKINSQFAKDTHDPNPKVLEDALKHEMFESKPFFVTFFGYYKDESREVLIKAKNELLHPAAVAPDLKLSNKN